MADPNEARTRREFLERAAAETREPDAARRMRDGASGDDGSLDDLDATSEQLAESGERLLEMRDALRERERELNRTGALAHDVAQGASALQADARRTADDVRAIPVEDNRTGDDGLDRHG